MTATSVRHHQRTGQRLCVWQPRSYPDSLGIVDQCLHPGETTLCKQGNSRQRTRHAESDDRSRRALERGTRRPVGSGANGHGRGRPVHTRDGADVPGNRTRGHDRQWRLARGPRFERVRLTAHGLVGRSHCQRQTQKPVDGTDNGLCNAGPGCAVADRPGYDFRVRLVDGVAGARSLRSTHRSACCLYRLHQWRGAETEGRYLTWRGGA